jgi:hypothetical protein
MCQPIPATGVYDASRRYMPISELIAITQAVAPGVLQVFCLLLGSKDQVNI